MDPIGDLLTRIRNANAKQKERVDVPVSKMKMEIVRILKDEGFIANYKSVAPTTGKVGVLRIFMKYSPEKEGAIRGLTRVSRPGLRIYRSYKEIPKGRVGFPVCILSTSKGVLTDRQARESRVGGEILCQIW